MTETSLRGVFDWLLQAHGAQDWWPAETPFEVMVGAILTQNTAWTNVERALERLVAGVGLDAARLAALPETELAELIRPAGYYNLKARRLQAFCRAYLDDGGFDGWSKLPTDLLRQRLLAIKGVGPETADDILLYAFERPVFVVDAYTRRLFERLGLIEAKLGYEKIRHRFESALAADAALFKEYHALIVRHAKHHCRKRPRCEDCSLNASCPASNT